MSDMLHDNLTTILGVCAVTDKSLTATRDLLATNQSATGMALIFGELSTSTPVMGPAWDFCVVQSRASRARTHLRNDGGVTAFGTFAPAA